MFARTAGLYSTPRRPVGVSGIQISRCFVVSSLTDCTAHCSAVCLTQLSLCRLVWLGLALCHLFRPGWAPGGPGPHNSHCAAFSACDPGCCGTRPPSHRPSLAPDNTPALNSNWHSGQGSARPSNRFNNIFNRNVFATFYQQPSLAWFLILTGKIRHIFVSISCQYFPL